MDMLQILEIVTILRVPFWRLIVIVVILTKETIVVVVFAVIMLCRVSVNLLSQVSPYLPNLPLWSFGFLYKC
jgi:hypothetical protein